MILFFALFAAVCLYGCKAYMGREYNRDYLSIDQTQMVKGFFIILVFLKHFNSYVTYVRYRDVLCGFAVDVLGS